jgi:hypothetical protein
MIAEFLREYRLAAAGLSEAAVADRAALDRRQATAERKVARLVRAVAEGLGEFGEIRSGWWPRRLTSRSSRASAPSLKPRPSLPFIPALPTITVARWPTFASFSKAAPRKVGAKPSRRYAA